MNAVIDIQRLVPAWQSLQSVAAVTHIDSEAQYAHGGWASQVTIVPAADTQPWQAPVGEFTNVGTLDGRASNWDLNGDGYLTQAESAGDLAFLG